MYDKHDLSGEWQRPDGIKVHLNYLVKPINWPVKSTIYKWLRAYWFDDASLISPIRLCTTLFLDKTYKEEKYSMQTSARFVQLGFYGALRFGSNRIDIYSPANGYQILSLRKVGINLPPYVPFSLGNIIKPESEYFDSTRVESTTNDIYSPQGYYGRLLYEGKYSQGILNKELGVANNNVFNKTVNEAEIKKVADVLCNVRKIN